MQKVQYGFRKRALENGQKRYFTGLPCTYGHVAERTTKNGRCVECVRIYAEKNRELFNARSARSAAQKGRAAENERIRKWARANPHKRSAKEARRRAALLQRMPDWLTPDDLWLMEEAYALAAARTACTGFLWHVDHVIPLQGRTVSGLHVPQNLRVIPAQDNLRKNNRFEVL